MAEPNSMGAYLRAARRRRRVSIERAAEETRIRADFLMRMESDEFDFLAPAYVRGFLRSYARFLGVNPDPLLSEFDRRYGTGRTDTDRIAAIEGQPRKSRAARSHERTRSYAPKERRRLSSWTVAAVVALGAIAVLALVGVVGGSPGPDASDESDDVAATEASQSPSPDAAESVAPSPSPSPTETLVVDDGIRLKVVATTAPCWVEVSTDGSPTPSFSETLQVGASETFTAEREMTVVLGFPRGVELIVNGTNVGSPGGVNPDTVNLPEDIDAL